MSINCLFSQNIYVLLNINNQKNLVVYGKMLLKLYN
ncbi:unnamed protein product [Schistosoma curassoni]|uniref:Uncharacterized protein n=1 Tax=Schistosoma curassoni TaxID=6186 RepID=A0A183JFY0_9TREM|nr:unnamed protein product [Schistosoma curassoni]